MKTTVNIDDRIMRKLKREAARQGKTMGELIEAALRLLLLEKRALPPMPPLPEFSGGGARVDIANREALYDFMER